MIQKSEIALQASQNSMDIKSEYLFTSDRLGFRNWTEKDLDEMTSLNNDPEVMRYFPSTQDRETTLAFIKKMQIQFEANQYCYFVVELLGTQEFVGFIGITKQDHSMDRGEFVDIGWGLKQAVWGQGLAPEGAKACLSFAYSQFGIKEIYALAVKSNAPSLRVMEKIGMKYQETFIHHKLIDYPKLKECVLYRINL